MANKRLQLNTVFKIVSILLKFNFICQPIYNEKEHVFCMRCDKKETGLWL